MNAVAIEEAISTLGEQPFDAEEFPYAFLLAFGNKDTTIKRLRKGAGCLDPWGPQGKPCHHQGQGKVHP